MPIDLSFWHSLAVTKRGPLLCASGFVKFPTYLLNIMQDFFLLIHSIGDFFLGDIEIKNKES